MRTIVFVLLLCVAFVIAVPLGDPVDAAIGFPPVLLQTHEQSAVALIIRGFIALMIAIPVEKLFFPSRKQQGVVLLVGQRPRKRSSGVFLVLAVAVCVWMLVGR